MACLLLGLVAVLGGCATPEQGSAADPSPATGEVSPWRQGDPQFTPPSGTTPLVGVQYHGVWDDHTPDKRRAVLDAMAEAGVRYLRMDVAWADLQPRPGDDALGDSPETTEADERLAEISARGMKTLLIVHWAPRWSTGTSEKNGVPRDADEFGRFAAWAADRWKQHLVGIELLNEANTTAFLANTDPATYTRLVTAAYDRIKAVAPDLTVVAGAPTYVDTDWYEKFFELGGAGSYDALGVHPYMGRTDAPPETCDESDLKHYPCNIPNLLDLMAANGDSDKQIWATEYGWSSHDNSGYRKPVPNWSRGVTQEQQAEYLLRMQSLLSQWPQVEASFWYTSWDRASGDPQMDNWGLLARDLERKPAWYAMRCAAGAVCGP